MSATPHRYEGRDLEAMVYAVRHSRWICEQFGAWLRGDLCEAGAGAGTFTELLKARGVHSLTALEPSNEMHALLAARFADDPCCTVHRATLAEWAPAWLHRFDTVVYNNVLEHIDDDAAELALARDVLKPGGALCIFVPALPFLMSDFDRAIGHHRRYVRRELRDKLERAGFRIERLHYVDFAGILPWLVSMRWLHGTLDRRKVALYDRFAIPVVSRLEALVKPPIGRNLLAVAVKPG